jgi:DNA-binding Xre family transcriptional regulator
LRSDGPAIADISSHRWRPGDLPRNDRRARCGCRAAMDGLSRRRRAAAMDGPPRDRIGPIRVVESRMKVARKMRAFADDAGGPHPIDAHVGSRLRLRRTMLRISQEKLAAELGLTFQQVQKYERAANRISASRLYQLCRILKVPVSFFFEGIEAEGRRFRKKSSTGCPGARPAAAARHHRTRRGLLPNQQPASPRSLS